MAESKKTLVIGASTNTERYSNKAIKMLIAKGHEVLALGLKTGEVAGVDIVSEPVVYDDIDTVTLYLNPQRQQAYYNYIIGLKPKRIIFNPGTENSDLEQFAQEHSIETTQACTLVLLSTGQY